MAPEESVIEYRLDELGRRITELGTHVDTGFDRIGGRIDKLEFVAKGTYEAEKTAARDFASETRRIAIQARALSMAVFTLVIGIAIAVVQAAT